MHTFQNFTLPGLLGGRPVAMRKLPAGASHRAKLGRSVGPRAGPSRPAKAASTKTGPAAGSTTSRPPPPAFVWWCYSTVSVCTTCGKPRPPPSLRHRCSLYIQTLAVPCLVHTPSVSRYICSLVWFAIFVFVVGHTLLFLWRILWESASLPRLFTAW